jgi:hypothetical protein
MAGACILPQVPAYRQAGSGAVSSCAMAAGLHLEQFWAQRQVLKPLGSIVDGVVYSLGGDLSVRRLLQALCQPQGQVGLVCCLVHLYAQTLSCLLCFG